MPSQCATDASSRNSWGDYMEAYEETIRHTSTDDSPWYVVPADNKWFARLAVAELLLDALEGLGLGWPEADFDITREIERLEQS